MRFFCSESFARPSGDPAGAKNAARMQCGYPRFFLHPLVRRLIVECEARFAAADEACLPLPSQRAAERCAEFVQRRASVKTSIHKLGSQGVFAVSVEKLAWRTALEYWQHAGEIVSSRLAQTVLDDIEGRTDRQPTTGTAPAASNSSAAREEKRALRERIAKLSGAASPIHRIFAWVSAGST